MSRTPGISGRCTWSSGDESVAAVDGSGLVTAGVNGKAFVEASVEGGIVPVYAKAGRGRGGVLVTIEPDRGVLLGLYEAMGGADWDRNHNWGMDAQLEPTWLCSG